MKQFLSVMVAVIALAVGTAVTADEVTVEQINTAFAEANDLRKQAGELAHEWRDTAKILKSAQEAAAEGDLEKAMKLIAEAKFQSEAAINQAERESRLWIARVVR